MAPSSVSRRSFTNPLVKPLRKHARYEVRLSRDLRDFGGNALPPSDLRFAYRTRR